jgi:DNA uptake protein ComE-like DNA-binding protein
MMRRATRQSERSHRAGGTILIVTIWVVLVLAGLALVFARSMRVSAIVAANHTASLEAECIAAGAVEYIRAQLVEGEEGEMTVNETSDLYQAMEVGEGYFWVLHSNLGDDDDYAYGLTDEAAKINLNSASQEMLQNLPGMTAELAASIIDWRDEDSEVSTGGAESEYYLLQPEAYNCKNAPLQTVEEILLIKDASAELLFGEDTNLNGVLDDHENDGRLSEPDDDRDGRLDTGFYDYVTVYSVEANTDGEGNDRININDSSSRGDLQTALQELFDEERALEIMVMVPTNPSFDNILEFYFQSGMKSDEFAQVADKLTTSDDETFPGLVNINTAPKEVLMCLPGLEESDADALLSYRESNSELSSIAWIVDVLDQAKAVAIGSYITVRSQQYSADIVCLSGNGRAYQRYKAVFDTQSGTPKVVYWKSLTSFGWPLNREIVTALREGEPLTGTILGMH